MVEEKTIRCKICNDEKSCEFFPKHKRVGKDSQEFYCYDHICNECMKPINKENSRKRYLEKGRREFENMYQDPIKKEEWLNKNKKYRENNRIKLLDYRKTRREKDRKNYIEWAKNKRKTDPNFLLRDIISHHIYISLKNQNSKKTKPTTVALQYTIKELKEHLENQFEHWMNWENHGVYRKNEWDDNDPKTWKWQIDHIIPHSTFCYTNVEDDSFKKCWALENLRPLSAKQNLIEGTNRIRH